jgi:DNA-directed RNA polymerase specialized sigma24 family protein
MLAALEGLRYLAYSRVPDEAEDVIQSSMLAGLNALERGAEIENPEAYIAAVVRNQIAHAIEARVRRRQILDIEAAACAGYEMEAAILDELDGPLLKRAIEAGLEELSDRDRDLVERFLREEAPEDIRRDLRMSHRQLRNRKYVAKRRIVASGRRGAIRLKFL